MYTLVIFTPFRICIHTRAHVYTQTSICVYATNQTAMGIGCGKSQDPEALTADPLPAAVSAYDIKWDASTGCITTTKMAMPVIHETMQWHRRGAITWNKDASMPRRLVPSTNRSRVQSPEPPPESLYSHSLTDHSLAPSRAVLSIGKVV